MSDRREGQRRCVACVRFQRRSTRKQHKSHIEIARQRCKLKSKSRGEDQGGHSMLEATLSNQLAASHKQPSTFQWCRAARVAIASLAMETNLPNSLDFVLHVRRTLNMRDNTLDDAQLETRCPLDNGRHDCKPISTLAISKFRKFPSSVMSSQNALQTVVVVMNWSPHFRSTYNAIYY